MQTDYDVKIREKSSKLWESLRCRFTGMALLAVAAALVTAVAAGPRLAAAAPKKGGTLVIGAPTDPPTFDQQRTTSITVAGLASLIYDTLVEIDYDLKTLTPGLAESWQVSPDGKTFTFKLRDDVKFHSGRKFTSADVKYTFERILNPPKSTQKRKIRSPHKFRLGQLKAIETPDETTLVLKFKSRRADLLVQLSNPFMGIIDREAVEKYGERYGAAGVGGTGPFMLDKWVVHDRAILKRFPDYRWGPSYFKNKGPAHIEEIVFRVIPEWQTLVFEFELGNVHTSRHMRYSDIEVLKRNKDIRILSVEPSQRIHFIGFKVTRPIIDDINVRKAINMAINKKELVKDVEHGYATMARGLFQPTVTDYWPGQESIFPEYSPAKAKALLDAAGWKPGPDGIRVKEGRRLKLTFIGMVESGHQELAPILQAQLKAVGIDLKTKVSILRVYLPGLRKQNYDMWALATPYVSIHEILNYWFSSKNIPSPNRGMWKDARTDELLLLGSAGETEEVRTKAVQELQKIVAENYLMVPFAHRKTLVPTRVEVKGFRPHGIYGSAYHKLLDVWLDK